MTEIDVLNEDNIHAVEFFLVLLLRAMLSLPYDCER